MPITVPCVRCKTKFQVPSKFAGQKVRCTNCGCMLRLPSPEVIQAKKQGIPTRTSRSAAGASAGTSAAAAKQAPRPSDDVVDIVDMFEETVEPSGQGTSASPAGAAPEPPVLSCSHCEGLLYYDPNFANQTVACPHCGNHLIMPEL